MARSDLILNLVKAAATNDQAQIQRTVEALAADERAKNHMVLADRLIAQMRNTNGVSRSIPAATVRTGGPLVQERIPSRSLDSLILPFEASLAVSELVEEQHRADLLRSFNLEPRNKVILTGPPGNGKTSLAEAIAHSLNVSLLQVRYEAVIGSYLGETAQRISQVFELARSRQCVLFFDEFDAVGKERGDTHETGEIKRVVSSLLMQIDSLPSYVVVVTASNHAELLDRAVWRRFQLRLNLPPPTVIQIEEWFRRFEYNAKHDFGISPKSLSQRLKGLSFAEVEEFGLDVLRRIVLSSPEGNPKTILKNCLEHWKKRFTPTATEV